MDRWRAHANNGWRTGNGSRFRWTQRNACILSVLHIWMRFATAQTQVFVGGANKNTAQMMHNHFWIHAICRELLMSQSITSAFDDSLQWRIATLQVPRDVFASCVPQTIGKCSHEFQCVASTLQKKSCDVHIDSAFVDSVVWTFRFYEGSVAMCATTALQYHGLRRTTRWWCKLLVGTGNVIFHVGSVGLHMLAIVCARRLFHSHDRPSIAAKSLL